MTILYMVLFDLPIIYTLDWLPKVHSQYNTAQQAELEVLITLIFLLGKNEVLNQVELNQVLN